MISAVIFVCVVVPLLGMLLHHKRLSDAAKRQLAAAPEEEDDGVSDEDFALSWYRAGVEKGWDMKSKDVLVTDLTVEQAFDDEWDSLDDQEADG